MADPRRARPRRCTRTSASSAARSRCRSRSEIVARPARPLRARRRRGQGQRLQQRPDPGARARLPARARRLHGRLGPRPQGEPRRARAPVRLSRPRRREYMRHTIVRWIADRPGARLEAGDNDEVAAPGEEVLMRRLDRGRRCSSRSPAVFELRGSLDAPRRRRERERCQASTKPRTDASRRTATSR